MKTVFIAGATGYLGRYLCEAFQRQGWYVTALVRNTARAQGLCADQLVEAEATKPETLTGIMSGADLVVSALGITRQTDGLGYWDVDYGANMNLLAQAEQAGVARFAYIHVLNADHMRHVPLVAAKSAFVDALWNSPMAATIIAPSGYFSDMGDFLSMARAGRVWLFGDGMNQINPIHGADLAEAVVKATEEGQGWLDIGGPEVFTHTQLAELALDCAGNPRKITYLPDSLRRFALWLLPHITPRKIHGPAQFFLTAMGLPMVGQAHGTRRLHQFFTNTTARSQSAARLHQLPLERK